jgi:hypothetical protein
MNKDTFVERVVGILSDRIEEINREALAGRLQQTAVKGGNKAVRDKGERAKNLLVRMGKDVPGGPVGKPSPDGKLKPKHDAFGVLSAQKKTDAKRRAATVKKAQAQQPKQETASHDPKVNFINRTVDNLVERLIGKQKKLDVNKSGKLDAQDFKMLRKGKRKDEAQDNIIEGLVKAANKMAKRNLMQKKGEDSSTATYGTAKDKPGDVDVRRARRDNKLDAKDPDDVAHTAKSNRMRKVRGY